MLVIEPCGNLTGGRKIYIKDNPKCYAEVDITSESKSILKCIVSEIIYSLRELHDINYTPDEIVELIFKEELQMYYDFFKDVDEKILFIHYIENDSGVKGLAKTIVDYMKENYKFILVNPVEEDRGYWEKNGFKNCFLNYYYYER